MELEFHRQLLRIYFERRANIFNPKIQLLIPLGILKILQEIERENFSFEIDSTQETKIGFPVNVVSKNGPMRITFSTSKKRFKCCLYMDNSTIGYKIKEGKVYGPKFSSNLVNEFPLAAEKTLAKYDCIKITNIETRPGYFFASLSENCKFHYHGFLNAGVFYYDNKPIFRSSNGGSTKDFCIFYPENKKKNLIENTTKWLCSVL